MLPDILMTFSMLLSDSSFIVAYVNESLGCNIHYIFILNQAKMALKPEIASPESIRCSFFQNESILCIYLIEN